MSIWKYSLPHTSITDILITFPEQSHSLRWLPISNIVMNPKSSFFLLELQDWPDLSNCTRNSLVRMSLKNLEFSQSKAKLIFSYHTTDLKPTSVFSLFNDKWLPLCLSSKLWNSSVSPETVPIGNHTVIFLFNPGSHQLFILQGTVQT